ncbi:MAG: rod-binding protein [Rhodospirillaceae bacterium]
MTPYASSATGAANAATAMAPALASRYGMASTPSAAGIGAGGFAASLTEASAKPVLPVGSLGTPAGIAAGAPAGGSRLNAAALNRKTEPETRTAIHKSAAEFESSALGQLLGFMTQNVEVDPTFGGGHGEEMFRDMLNTEYGKMLHKGGRTGIAAQVERQLLRAQGLKPLSGPGSKG